MFPLINYYLKQNSILILLIIIAGLLGRFFVSGIEVVNVFLVAALAYRFGAEERSKQNWHYFHSLPINFWEKSVVKIVFPVLLLSILWMSGDLKVFHASSGQPTQQLFWGILLQSTMLILSSLMARSLIQFALYVIGLYLVNLIFDQSLAQVFLVCLYLALSLYTLSDKRWNFGRTIAFAIIIATPLAIVDRLANERILLHRLTSLNFMTRMDAAQLLLAKSSDHPEASQALSAMLQEDLANEMSKRLFRILAKYKVVANIPEERFWQLIAMDRRTRESIYRYFLRLRQSYPWVNTLEFIERAESYTLHGRPPCEDDCEDLVDLVEDYIFTVEGGGDHIRQHLQSDELIKQYYALSIIEHQPELMFRAELEELKLNTSHPGLLARVDLVLNNWKLSEIGVGLSAAIRKKIDAKLKDRLSKSQRRQIGKLIDEQLRDED